MRNRIGKSFKLLVGQAQRGLDRLHFSDVGINAHPESHLTLTVKHGRGTVRHGVKTAVPRPQSPNACIQGFVGAGQLPVGLELGHVVWMHSAKPLASAPVRELSAHQVVPGAIEISDSSVRICRPHRLRCLLGQCPEQSLLTRQGQGPLSHFLLQPGIEFTNFFQQPGVFYGGRSQVPQFQRHVFILLGEVSFVFIGQLEQANVFAVSSSQRHREPAAHRRMLVGIVAVAAPAGMRFKLGLCHADWAVVFANHRRDASAVHGVCQALVSRIFVRQRQRMNRLQLIAIAAQAHQRLVRANHATRLPGNFLHRALQRLVPGDGLCGICSALQGKQVVLHVLFGLVLGRFVDGHHKPGRPTGILNRLRQGFNREKASVLAPVPPQRFLAYRIVQPLAQMRMFSRRTNVKNRHRHELLRRITIALNDRLVHCKIARGGDVIDPHRDGCRFKQRRVTVLTFDQRLLGQFALGDVPLHRHPMREPAFFIGNRHDVEFEPELASILGVIQQFGTHGLPGFQRLLDTIQLGAIGFWALQNTRRLAQHFFTAVAGTARKSVVDEHDTRPGLVNRFGFCDHHHVVQVANAGFKQA